MRTHKTFFPYTWWLHIPSDSVFVVTHNLKAEADDEMEIYVVFKGSDKMLMRLASDLFEKLIKNEIKQVQK